MTEAPIVLARSRKAWSGWSTNGFEIRDCHTDSLYIATGHRKRPNNETLICRAQHILLSAERSSVVDVLG